MADLPKRTADTMSDAIALSSPNGRMSKRARKAANDRLAKALFGDHCTREDITGRDERPEKEKKRESLLRTASMLRGLAEKGMHPRKYAKKAAELEAEAEALL